MHDQQWLAEQFETHRPRLRALAYQMLGSLSEADDAVQESWLRLSRSDTSSVENLGGWLTTVVGRVCLDMLRWRKSRREQPLDAAAEATASRQAGINPEEELLLADSVGLALLVVLDTLTPAERIAFVLHDIFAVPFEAIAPVVGRTPAAARKLASRARQRVHGPTKVADQDLTHKRALVDAFLAASRKGDFAGMLSLLDPDAVMRVDVTAMVSTGAPAEARGATTVATLMNRRAVFARSALIDGRVGAVVAPGGRLWLVLGFTLKDGKVVQIDVIADPERLRQMTLAVL